MSAQCAIDNMRNDANRELLQEANSAYLVLVCSIYYAQQATFLSPFFLKILHFYLATSAYLVHCYLPSMFLLYLGG